MAKNNAAALHAWRRFLIWNAYRFILIYTRPWSRKMHFFIRFREQGRATAHDFVVAHIKIKQYLCRRLR